jgi:hypothetical protein
MTRGTRWLLIEILTVLALVNTAAALQTAQSIPAQLALGVSFPPGARLAVNIGWTVLFVILVLRLWQHPRVTIRFVPPVLTLYGVINILWLVLFARSNFDRGRIGFQAVATVLLLLPLWWICRDRPVQVNPTGLSLSSAPKSVLQSPGSLPAEPPIEH